MSPLDREKLPDRLSALLPGRPKVEITGTASVGAQRHTLFLALGEAPSARRAVAQIATGAVVAAPVTVEAALLRAVRAAGVPVPALLGVDAARGALICSHVDGETIPRRILRRIRARPALAAALATDCGQALAGIHRVPTEDLPRLENLADPRRYADEMEAGLSLLSTPHPSFRLGVHWLRRHAPDEGPEPRLVHGDFRIGNLIVGEDGLAAVLDWELAHLGDPMEDLAWLCLRTWRFGENALEVGGFARLERLREAYSEAGGEWREDAFHWWTVARTLWWGIGLAQQAQAFLEGASQSIVLAASGRRVAELEYDLLRLIDEGPARSRPPT